MKKHCTGMVCLSLLLHAGIAGAATGGDAVVYPEKQKQLIADWGYDIKQGGKASRLTPSHARTLFVTDKMTLLRIPIWGTSSKPAHPADGVVVESYYDDILYAMTNARNTRPDVVLFCSKKLDGQTSFPDWVKDANGVIPALYARLLADYLQFMESKGFVMHVLGPDNEKQFNEGNITAERHKDIVDALRTLSQQRGFAMPLIIGPENFGPYQGWLNTLYNNGWFDRLDIAGTHYYPRQRPPVGLNDWSNAARNLPQWHSELHWAGASFADYQNSLGAIFDCTDTGFIGFAWWDYTRSGNKGEMERYVSSTSVKSRPIDIDDIDGTGINTAGELQTRAFRQGRSIAVWAMNAVAATSYDSYGFDLDVGAIAGDVTYHRWTDSASATGLATRIGDNRFELTIPGESITLFTFQYVPPGPEAYYPLDGDATDVSGNNNHGNLFGNPGFAAGPEGQAIDLDGVDDYVRIPKSIHRNFSIAFWIRTTMTGQTGGSNQWWEGSGLVDGDIAGTAGDFGVSLHGSEIAFGVGQADTTIKSTSRVNDGVWHHVAVTRNSAVGEMMIYIDGVQETTGMGPKGIKNAGTDLRIGSIQTHSGFFEGQIDEVQILSRILHPDEVWALTHPPAAPTNLTAMPGNAAIHLNWDDNTDTDLAGYNVYRSTTGGSGYNRIASGVSTSDYLDRRAINGTTYYYVVRAVDTDGNEGDAASEVFATPSSTTIYDDFESGDFFGGTGWSNRWWIVGQSLPSISSLDGNHSAKLIYDGRMTRMFDEAVDHATLRFLYDIDSLDDETESAVVEVFNGRWQTVWSAGEEANGADSIESPNNIADDLREAIVNLDAHGELTGIRFTIRGTGTWDFFFVDEITLVGSTPQVALAARRNWVIYR